MKTGKEELIEVENRIEKVLGKLPSMPSIQTLEDQLAVSVFHSYLFITSFTVTRQARGLLLFWNEYTVGTVPDCSKRICL
jgi:hypothetical protein